jgi:hypothetical protein
MKNRYGKIILVSVIAHFAVSGASPGYNSATSGLAKIIPRIVSNAKNRVRIDSTLRAKL